MIDNDLILVFKKVEHKSASSPEPIFWAGSYSPSRCSPSSEAFFHVQGLVL